jgi:hypothetical protein
MEFLQEYLINCIEGGTRFYENAIKDSEYCIKALWEPWFKAVGLE